MSNVKYCFLCHKIQEPNQIDPISHTCLKKCNLCKSLNDCPSHHYRDFHREERKSYKIKISDVGDENIESESKEEPIQKPLKKIKKTDNKTNYKMPDSNFQERRIVIHKNNLISILPMPKTPTKIVKGPSKILAECKKQLAHHKKCVDFFEERAKIFSQLAEIEGSENIYFTTCNAVYQNDDQEL
ncbi:hypothetical protein DICPUDRAFT_146532 [Dictyostelium purpureum]|uniref:Uncharacterized protein n=1 Tax=Dictyostelium purpureum TaxID=5786 RepID=F0Z678_DICPU|nr:uncharacterized protein DICPUDRAFT_146532 [Dictyostelium purpureum]EGC40550.1 hypothetical protein DICPUDRAFT_146532 [Dictyostelium purpureum]|eukprot:XP_003282886.1 hypothetical protein DICPUDRAFT_146532 [Dictyostelium purpureum]